MIAKLIEIARYRELIQCLVVRDLKVRYHGSVLGFFWSLLHPLLMMVLYTVVFSVFLRIEVEHYPLFLISALLPWNFFVAGLNQGSQSLVGNAHFIQKFYCPRELFPLTSILSHSILLFNSLVMIIPFILFYKGEISPSFLLLPVVIFIQLIFGLGLSLILSCLQVFYRDVIHILELFLLFWFFLTPILYPLSMVPEKLQPLFYLNPMFLMVNLYRSILYEGAFPGFSAFLIVAIVAVGTLVIGWKVFLSREQFIVKEL